MWYTSLLTFIFAFRSVYSSEFSLDGGDNYQGGTVYPGAVDCGEDKCADESDQSVGIYSLYDIAHDAGAMEALPLEVRTAIGNRVFGSRLLGAVQAETEPGGHFGSYYSQIAVSKVQVKAPANDITCVQDDGSASYGLAPASYTGLHANCATSANVDELASSPSGHTAQLCVGLQQDADERCQEVWWRGRTVGVLPYMDVTATNAVDDTTIDPAYPVNMRSRLSHFNEGSLQYDTNAGGLVRDTTAGTYCSYDADPTENFDHMLNYGCIGDHFCPPSTDAPMFDTSGGFQQTFMDRCFPYTTMLYGNGQRRFSMTAEPGTPPPGDWNKAGWNYESALVASHDCDPSDATSENILLGVDDSEQPRCLYSPADKTGAGAKITLVGPSNNELLYGTDVYQQHVMYYSPVHVFVSENGAAYRYTIRATMPMFWGLLVGVLHPSTPDVAVPDITFPFAETHHINLAYDWVPGANDEPGRWRPPMPSPTDAQGNDVLAGEPTTYIIGTIMNVRYNGVLFDCVADDAPCTGGPVTSYEGITNLEERAFKFATRLTIDRTTVGGLVSADTVVSGVALDLSLNSQSCYKYAADPTPSDVIFQVSFSGLEEAFVVSVQSVEYFHTDGTTTSRVVFESDNAACVTRLGDTPGPGCFDVRAGFANRNPDRYAATAAVKLPMDGCRDDFNSPVGDCVQKMDTWLGVTSGSAAERKIYVTYTMAFGDNSVAAQGFVRRQEISCANAGIYCNALIRADAASNLAQCDEDSAVGTEITINQFTDLVSASLAVVGQPQFQALRTRPPCIALDPTSGDETVTCPAMLHDQCEVNSGVASVQHIMEKCGSMWSLPNIKASNAIVTGTVEGEGLTVAGGEIESEEGVTAGTSVPVLGNGLGFMHLGAVAGPKTQPTTKQQAARQLIFPVGARLTAKCGDNPPVVDAQVFGGFDTSGDWLLTASEWEHNLGMPAGRYDDMKALMEDVDTLALIEPALKSIDEDTLLTAKLLAVDSPSTHAFANARGCHRNDMKPFSFLDQVRADGFCEWVKTGATNTFVDACNSHAAMSGGLDVQGFLASAGGGISHGPSSAADCHNGPAMVLGFNDQSPQYTADPESLAVPDQVPPCAPESNRDRDGDVVKHDAGSDTCDLGIDDVCTANKGYRGCALLPMQNDLQTATGTSLSFYDRFKTLHTSDGRPSAAVMSALGVNINTAYLSQCGSQPTEWMLETQFVHIDGLTPLGTAGSHDDPTGACTYVSPVTGEADQVRTTPVADCAAVAAGDCNDAYAVWDRSICSLVVGDCVRLGDVCEFSPAPPPSGGSLRRLTTTNVRNTYHVAAAENATGAAPTNSTRSLQEADTESHGSIVTALTEGVALPCSDATVGVHGVLGQACLCDPHTIGSPQCSIAFVNATPPPPPPPPPPSDMDDSDWIAVVGIGLILCLMVVQLQKQSDDVTTVINLQQSLLSSRHKNP